MVFSGTRRIGPHTAHSDMRPYRDPYSPELAARIGNVTCLSPGLEFDKPFVSGNGSTVMVFGTGPLEGTVTGNAQDLADSDKGIMRYSYDFGHDATCAFKKASQYLKAHSGTPCTNRMRFTRRRPHQNRLVPSIPIQPIWEEDDDSNVTTSQHDNSYGQH